MPARRHLASLLCSALAVSLCTLSFPADAGSRSVAVDAGVLLSDPDGLSLRPGEFSWLEDAQADAGSPVTLLVSLRDQRGYLYREGRRIAVTTVSTGTPVCFTVNTVLYQLEGTRRASTCALAAFSGPIDAPISSMPTTSAHG